MKFVFRVDSSNIIGTGHLVRCMTLASVLNEKHEILFVCRDLPSHLSSLVSESKMRLKLIRYESPLTTQAESLNSQWKLDAELTLAALKEEHFQANVVIVDHYGLDEKWESELQNSAPVFVIDDLGNRRHSSWGILDQNFHSHPERVYEGLLSPSSRKLFGPEYALLKPAFSKMRDRGLRFSGQVDNISIFYGGVDAPNETSKALLALSSLKGEYEITVIIGSSNPHRPELEKMIAEIPKAKLFVQVPNMEKYFYESDLSLGAGGTTLWERCCLGLPTLVTAIAPNQEKVASETSDAGYIKYLGTTDEVSVSSMAQTLSDFIERKDLRREMAKRAARLVDGLGASKVAQVLEGIKS